MIIAKYPLHTGGDAIILFLVDASKRLYKIFQGILCNADWTGGDDGS